MNLHVAFGPQLCGDLATASTREWLVPDGLGGYAMGTVSGLATRRYHALLVVAGQTPAQRRVGLVALDPVITTTSTTSGVRLATHEWHDGTVAPRGYELLESFTLHDGLPVWRWRLGETVIERSLAMRHGTSCVAVVDTLIEGGPCTISVDALCTWRDAHGERGSGNGALRVESSSGGAVVESAYRLRGPNWTPRGEWWLGAHHREEAARGMAATEDLLHAGSFSAELARPGDCLEVVAWSGDLGSEPPPAREIIEAAGRRNAGLDVAADAFVVRTSTGPDVVAGYPWFGAWSRDTMISFDGLFLHTGRFGEGRDLLRNYAETLSEGMLANTCDGGAPQHNTADGTLWFLHAIDRHVTVTGDTDLAAELLPALREIYDWHVRGTRYGIGVDPADGLLRQGAPGEALTWMDARVDGVPITQRAGKAVDINALWCNGLAVLAQLSDRVGADGSPFATHRDRAVAAFRNRFPLSRHTASASASPSRFAANGGLAAPEDHALLQSVTAVGGTAPGLFDVVDPDDAALRPNALLAWSLPHAPMEPDAAAVRRIADALLTPLGPRSLAPTDPAFRPRHRGTMADRDRAYHQGTVWPWLIGPMADAMRVSGLPTEDIFTGLTEHLSEWGLGSVSETADGAAPHDATGCPFQAWSVAEFIRTCR
ncbi:putative glycogen debranching enzyme [Allocatelliglobosispora scoriae]|uniref:Putative glycogen debranching enzyme n=1 Tax=Allocatelliglobosispora scoriae TaxID=643052 RepID=A0A841C0E2_9ACTN|nr:putative glycogen debranching enzyme [Allocatelliglobosispora scoriae]